MNDGTSDAQTTASQSLMQQNSLHGGQTPAQPTEESVRLASREMLVRIRTLRTEFPHLSAQKINDAFVSCNGDLALARNALRTLPTASQDVPAGGVSVSIDDASTPPPQQQGPQPREKSPSLTSYVVREKIITGLGWSFDVFLILVNLTDVVSDCLIARQFWLDGHTTFFWLVLASLMLANIIYTVVGVEVLLRDKHSNKGHRVWQYLLVFPFAQLIPVLNWLSEQMSPSAAALDVAKWIEPEKEFDTGVAAAEFGAMAGASHVMSRLDRALARHLRSHALFYVESICEAIPQSIVQLVAVSALGTATPLQVFSLALSMVSIVSKGYVLSRAFGVPEMVYKFFVGAHDLFGMFFIFATLISNTSSKDVHLVGDLYVDYMSAIWLVKVAVFWGYTACVSLGVGMYVLSRLTCRDITRPAVGNVLLFGSLGALVLAPAMLVIEGVKLLWVNCIVTVNEPDNNMFPRLAMWYSFCNRAATQEEAGERFRYICLRFIDSKYSAEAVKEQKQQARTRRTTARHIHPPPPPPKTQTPHEGSPLCPTDRSGGEAVNQFQCALEDRRAKPLRQLQLESCPHYIRLALPILQTAPYDRWKLIRLVHSDAKFNPPTNWVDRLLVLVSGVALLLYTLGQLYSLVFPFVHFAIARNHQNLLQQFCFYGTAATFAVVLLLSPFMFRYIVFLLQCGILTRLRPNFLREGDLLEKYIEDYFIPPHVLFLADRIDPRLLNFDLVTVVAAYLRREDLNLKTVTVDECVALRRELMGNLMFDLEPQP